MTLPAGLLWSVKIHENVLHVMHFDVVLIKVVIENYTGQQISTFFFLQGL